MILPTTDELGGTCHTTGQGLLVERGEGVEIVAGGGGVCMKMYRSVSVF